jgi:hypothetical protein
MNKTQKRIAQIALSLGLFAIAQVAMAVDIVIMTNNGNVVLQVLGGVTTLIVEGKVKVISLGQAGIKTKDGKVTGVDSQRLSQTMSSLYPDNARIKAVAADVSANAAKIDKASMATTGTTVINASPTKDTKAPSSP